MQHFLFLMTCLARGEARVMLTMESGQDLLRDMMKYGGADDAVGCSSGVHGRSQIRGWALSTAQR
jgi:hypothetical protein